MAKKLLLIMIVSIFFLSCGGHFFNPRYYYNKGGSGSSDSNIPDTTPDKEPDAVPEDQDPFKKVTNENAGGYPASKFDSWLFKSSFRDSKLPDYKFFDDSSRLWQMGQDWNNNKAYYYLAKDSDNNTASGFAINNMKIYKYSKENPLYSSAGYLSGRMDRFNFYSIDGVTGLAFVTVPLKQYLIAVDTYTKFIFAFGKITSIDTVAGEKVPKIFEAVEKYGDYDFYEYDPIGYVKSDGTVVLYEHYQVEFVKDPTSYFPKIHPQFDKVAEYSLRGAGRSPYYIELNNGNVTEDDINKFNEAMKLASSEYKWRDYSGYNSTDPSSKSQISDLDSWVKNYSGKSLILYTYKFEDVNDSSNIIKGKLTIQTEVFDSNQIETKVYLRSAVNSSTKATYTNISNPSDIISIVLTDDKNTIIVGGVTLDSNFVDYGPIFVDRLKNARFEYGSAYLPAGNTYIPGLAGTMFGGTVKNIVYQFNSDGTEFTLEYSYKGKVYKYNNKLARFDSDADKHWTAKYESNPGGSMGNYTRVVLRNGEGTSNPGVNDKGSVIRSSMTLHKLEGVIDLGVTKIPDDPTSNLGLEMIGNRIR